MTIRDFEIFIAVAETGQMGVASRKLYITQPTVSHAIMQIEKEYHVKLFERLSKKLYITETGREFLEYARHITATYHEMEQFLYHASSQQCIHIGASLTVGSFFLSDIITGYEAENPNVNIRVYIDNSMNIIRKISEGTLDVAVIEGNVKTRDVIFKDIFEDEMVLICGKTHPFAGRSSINLTDLAGKAFVLREEGSGTRKEAEKQLKRYGIDVERLAIVASMESQEAIKRSVANGMGISIISRLAAEEEIRAGKVLWRKVPGEGEGRDINIVYNKNFHLSKSAERFIRVVKEMYEIQK